MMVDADRHHSNKGTIAMLGREGGEEGGREGEEGGREGEGISVCFVETLVGLYMR